MVGQVKKKRLRYMALKKEKEGHKSSVSLRNVKLSVVCSKILTTPKLNFVNRLGIKLLPGENKDRKKERKKPFALLQHTHTNAHTCDVGVLLNFVRTCARCHCTLNYRALYY